MKLVISLILLFTPLLNEKIRLIPYQGTDVRTTYDVPEKFLGIYKGAKTGFLELKADGSGEYNYDIFGFAPASCKRGSIEMEWGFLLDENNKIVSFEREYGRSYPVLMRSTGETQFQGCRTEVMLDFILEMENGDLEISSSDDWIKHKP